MKFKYFKNDIKQSNLYIGEKAGKRISNNINRAKKYIKIISPYFGKHQIKQLIDKSKNIAVSLISTDSNKGFKNPKYFFLLKDIIKQEPITNETNKKIFEIIKLITNIFSLLYFLILGVLIYLQLNNISSFLFHYKYIYGFLFLLIPIMNKIKKSIKIYSYKYHTLFPLIFVKNPSDNFKTRLFYSMFIHSKLYIIDDNIAFIGSVNFTSSGFYKSYETLLTINDKEVVKELSSFFDELIEEKWDKLNISELGKVLYKEPIN